jgi:DNA-directed RNA polymerase subunit RPC12/RpoP
MFEVHRCDKCQKRFDQEFEWECLGETVQEDTIICPYCGHEYDSFDLFDFEGGKHSEIECEICGKHFDLEVREIRSYSTKRSLCDMPEDFDPKEYDDEQ